MGITVRVTSLAIMFVAAIAAADVRAQAPAPPQAAQKERLEKIAPDAMVVSTYNGVGSVTIVFFAKTAADAPSKEKKEPRVETSDATGGTFPIPHPAITFSWEQPPGDADPRLSIGRLSVTATNYIEPGVEYKGKLIFTWESQPEPQKFDFSVIERPVVSFNLNKERISASLGTWQPKRFLLTIENSGKVNITEIAIAADDLTDEKGEHRIPPLRLADQGQQIDIPPGARKEVELELPTSPVLAGKYTGTLRILANGKAHKDVSVALSTRGPVWGGWYGFPLSLFGVLVLVTYGLSVALDKWFGLGGLQRAEATRSLVLARGKLKASQKVLSKWQDRHNVDFQHATPRLTFEISVLDAFLNAISSKSKEQIEAEAKRYALLTDQTNLLVAAMEIAISNLSGDPTKLKAKLIALDQVPLTDVESYRAALLKVLQAETTVGDRASALNQVWAASFPAAVTLDGLSAKITGMALLNTLVVCLLVCIFAYVFFYAKDPEFGTLLDYIAVFMWAFGLTTTGAGLMARLRASQPSG